MFIKIAIRNLLRQLKRTFLLITAIAVGFSVTVLIEGLFSGYIDAYQYKIAKAEGGHVYIEYGLPIPTPIVDMLERSIKSSGVEVSYTNKRIEANAEFLFDTVNANFNMVGMDCKNDNFIRDTLVFKEGSWDYLTREDEFTVLNPEHFAPSDLGSLDEIQRKKELPETISIKVRSGIIIPDLIAKEFGLKIGDKVKAEIYNHYIRGSSTHEFFIAGIYKSSESFGTNIYVDKNYLMQIKGYVFDAIDKYCVFLQNPKEQDFLANKIENELREKPSVGVMLTNRKLAKERNPYNPIADIYLQVGEIYKQYRSGSGVYRVTTLEDSSPDILSSPKRMNKISFSVLAVILIIIMFGISNAFRIILKSRMKEIGTMRAFGTEASQVLKMIMIEALFLGIAGVILGFVIALIILFTISAIPISELSTLYRFTRSGKMIWQLSAGALIPKVLITLIFVNIAVLIPTLKAVNTKPAETMREQ